VRASTDDRRSIPALPDASSCISGGRIPGRHPMHSLARRAPMRAPPGLIVDIRTDVVSPRLKAGQDESRTARA